MCYVINLVSKAAPYIWLEGGLFESFEQANSQALQVRKQRVYKSVTITKATASEIFNMELRQKFAAKLRGLSPEEMLAWHKRVTVERPQNKNTWENFLAFMNFKPNAEPEAIIRRILS